ncbi:hypothetical protein [Nonomuraea diastatica]|uniref:Uncharacterized protein n=1 Tax=Nonomuraea diastatica TaxID=1848329 RepID=A0A4R4WD41_9ACTN|nr:hypothetical protein [Nonomuraea diastatica]TDD16809.1 hypothetical protein E1294_29980 [Nonomuraea diastatica]
MPNSNHHPHVALDRARSDTVPDTVRVAADGIAAWFSPTVVILSAVLGRLLRGEWNGPQVSTVALA